MYGKENVNFYRFVIEITTVTGVSFSRTTNS